MTAPPGGIAPTPYRYRALLERAKQLVALAQQLEGSFLSLMEREEVERYQMMKARQDLSIAGTTVALQALRLTEADRGKQLSILQSEKAIDTWQHYNALIVNGWLEGEAWSLNLQWTMMGVQFGIGAIRSAGIIAAGTGADVFSGGVLAGLGTIAGAVASAAADPQVQQAFIGGMSNWSAGLSMWASYQRREEEWRFQLSLATTDMAIATIQQNLASDRYNIVSQEKRISELGQDHAQDTVNFLQNKFTNVELYDFMGDVVGAAYKYMLQEATSVALMAQRQLAFERQNGGVDLVVRDYWSSPNSSLSAMGDNAPDRRGMTGSTRLLQDLTKLDQFAFTTDKRRHQITRTISLAMLDPVAFQMFRSTGVLPFATPMELFDRDFPGHYLRLIKRVRVSVFALVPPAEGIKATLSGSSTSRVIRGPQPFEEATIVRDPESVALSGTINATGLFELQEQGEMLLPFEGSGVASSWELSMPKAANRFDFNTIADIFFTVDYTAYEDSIYKAEVVERLGTSVSLMRPFSLRTQFADAWYDLHHPELVDPNTAPLTARFTTRPADFPPNVSELRVREVELYVALQDGTIEALDLDLRFKPIGAVDGIGGPATTNPQNMAGTRTGNAAGWATMIGRAPTGEWTLRFDDNAGVRELFKDQRISDVILAITYTGETPSWPV
jgi:hypothetical protein